MTGPYRRLWKLSEDSLSNEWTGVGTEPVGRLWFASESKKIEAKKVHQI